MFAQYPTVAVTRTRDQLFPGWRRNPPRREYATSAATASSSSSSSSQVPTPAPTGAAAGSSIGTATARYTAYIGLGTNLGARPGNLNDAVSRLDRALQAAGGRVVETSWMYESEAMYHQDQDKFLNAAVKVSSRPPPILRGLYEDDPTFVPCPGGADNPLSSRLRRRSLRSSSSRR